MIPFIITQGSTITMVLNNKPYTIQSDHLNYDQIVTELKDPDQDINLIEELVNVSQVLKEYTRNTTGIEIDFMDGVILYNGNQIHGTLVDRIFDMYDQGFDFEPMCLFLINLYQNPSQTAIEELYSFIEYGKLPITDDGHFLAYKRVRDDYTSCHDQKTKNDIGTVVSMPREDVDTRSSNTCSSGLHLCSYEYLQHFNGDRVVILKVNPKDVVSIPADYKNTKARACAYEIIGEVTQEELSTNKTIFDAPIISTQKELSQLDKSIVDLINQYNGSIHVMSTPECDIISEQAIEEALFDFDSGFFKASYNNGYYEGKYKFPYDDMEIAIGDSMTIANRLTIVLDKKQTHELNFGYDLGFKHGKGHKSRLVKESNFTNLHISL